MSIDGWKDKEIIYNSIYVYVCITIYIIIIYVCIITNYTHTHTHTHTHTPYWFCFTGEPWLIHPRTQPKACKVPEGSPPQMVVYINSLKSGGGGLWLASISRDPHLHSLRRPVQVHLARLKWEEEIRSKTLTWLRLPGIWVWGKDLNPEPLTHCLPSISSLVLYFEVSLC